MRRLALDGAALYEKCLSEAADRRCQEGPPLLLRPKQNQIG